MVLIRCDRLRVVLAWVCGLAHQVVVALDPDDDDLAVANGAAVSVATIFGLSGGLLLLLYLLLKYAERVDKNVEQEIDDLRRKRALSKDVFRQHNGYTWDYVLVFEVRAEDKELTSYQRKFSLKEVLTRLNAGGIETRMFYSVQRDEVYCKIRCPLERLQREADRVGYKTLLDANNLRSTCQHGRPGKWAAIVIQDEYNESPYEAYEYIYAPASYTADRPEMDSLYKKYGGLERDVMMIPFRGTDRLKLMYSILVAKRADMGCNLDILRLVKSKCLLAFFPLHDKVELRALQRKWLQYFRPPWKEPTDDVKNYFGEKIGLYFLWLGHYTTWLIPASIVGVLAWVHVAMSGNNPNALGSALFSIFIGLWTTLFTEFWKRKEARCAMRWGMSGFEEQEQTRPQYKGIRSSSTIDGKPMDYFPPSESRKRFFLSQTVILGLILAVIAVVASIFWLKYFLTQPDQAATLEVWGVPFATIIPPMVNAMQIQVMNAFYGKVAIKLTDLENHRTDTEYEDNLIAKTFMFQFVNSYASLAYIAFIKGLIGQPCLVSCMNELSTNLGTVFLVRLACGNLSEVVSPILKERRKQREETMGSDPERTFSGPEREYIKETYDVMLGTFADYAEMIIQFGYVTLFVAAYPLSCFMALVNNYIEIRVDAWKLCQVSRRPEPRGAECIGTWYTILTIMSSLAVVSNSAIIAFTSEIFEHQSWMIRVWIFLGIEHGMLLFKYGLETLINDTPSDVDIQLKRNEFLVSKVVHNMPDEDDEEAVRASMPTLSDHTILNSDD
ncbi:unnamed protein product [Pylaiella littoralis]